MKKKFLFTLAVGIMISFASCGSKESHETDKSYDMDGYDELSEQANREYEEYMQSLPEEIGSVGEDGQSAEVSSQNLSNMSNADLIREYKNTLRRISQIVGECTSLEDFTNKTADLEKESIAIGEELEIRDLSDQERADLEQFGYQMSQEVAAQMQKLAGR